MQAGVTPQYPRRHVNYLIYLILNNYTLNSRPFEPKISFLQQKLTKIRIRPLAGRGGYLHHR